MAACPECGTSLRGVSETQLEEHVREKYPIICGDCGKSNSAKAWRDGKEEKVDVISSGKK